MAMNLPSQSGSGRRHRGRSPMAEINVTPFVDVMLVLLIIFMVTAPLLIAGVPIELPDSRAEALDQDREPVQISIDDAGVVYIGDEVVPNAELPGRFAALTTDAASPPQVMLRGDRAIDYALVMAVMGELSAAGITRISLVTTGSSNEP